MTLNRATKLANYAEKSLDMGQYLRIKTKDVKLSLNEDVQALLASLPVLRRKTRLAKAATFKDVASMLTAVAASLETDQHHTPLSDLGKKLADVLYVNITKAQLAEK